VLVTVCVATLPSKESVNVGPTAPSLRVNVYLIVPLPLAVMRPMNLIVVGQGPV
jgi:hypothetical protein